MEGYLTIKEISEKWNITPRRVQKMCADGLIPGVTKFGKSWAIPDTVDKPDDGRVKTGKYKNWRNNKRG